MLHGFQYLVADSSLLLASSVRSGLADMTCGSCAHSVSSDKFSAVCISTTRYILITSERLQILKIL